MQIVQYVHRSGEALPDHARVTEVSAATADVVRPNAHGALDALLNDIKAGWIPETADAAAEKANADAAVTAAEAQLKAAQDRQAEAEKKLAGGGATSGSGSGSGADTGKRGPLPDDFPGVTALRDAGITTYAKLRAYGDVTDIPGIGAATEAKIQAALA